MMARATRYKAVVATPNRQITNSASGDTGHHRLGVHPGSFRPASPAQQDASPRAQRGGDPQVREDSERQRVCGDFPGPQGYPGIALVADDEHGERSGAENQDCLLYTSDAADEED